LEVVRRLGLVALFVRDEYGLGGRVGMLEKEAGVGANLSSIVVLTNHESFYFRTQICSLHTLFLELQNCDLRGIKSIRKGV
jgi:hypothetical protein